MNDRPVSDLRTRINGYVGLDDAFRSDSNSRAQEAIRTYTRVGANHCALAHKTESPDRYSLPEFRSWFDDRIRMDARVPPFRRIEQRDRPHEGQFGLLCNEECLACFGAPGE